MKRAKGISFANTAFYKKKNASPVIFDFSIYKILFFPQFYARIKTKTVLQSFEDFLPTQCKFSSISPLLLLLFEK